MQSDNRLGAIQISKQKRLKIKTIKNEGTVTARRVKKRGKPIAGKTSFFLKYLYNCLVFNNI